jgi:hypothetical protein
MLVYDKNSLTSIFFFNFKTEGGGVVNIMTFLRSKKKIKRKNTS